ncbi:MAG: TSUP family transporter [Actinomycetota bacterium]|nr:TSUP family transporter [Actinomycetota bacterium]
MRLVAIGLVAGFLSAIFGVGGGFVVVPLLVALLKFEPRVATGTSLLAIFLTALAGTISYAAHGEVKLGSAAIVGLPAAVGAVAGTALQQRLTNRVLAFAFAALLVAVAVRLLV